MELSFVKQNVLQQPVSKLEMNLPMADKNYQTKRFRKTSAVKS